MQYRILKYSVPLQSGFRLEIPANHEILHFGSQNDNLFMWIKVHPDPSAEVIEREFYLRGTGHFIEADKFYLGTVVGHQGKFVWHLFGDDV